MGTEWGPGGELTGKGEHQLAPNSRSSDASRSEGGSSAANAFKTSGVNVGATAPPADNGAIKKKRTPKFLTKQFEILTKTSSATTPRRNVKLLGQDYIIAVPGSRAQSSVIDNPIADPDPHLEDQRPVAIAERSTDSVIPLADQHHNVEKPPIEFVIAPVDYKTDGQRREVARAEPPLDYITERSPRMSPRVAALSTRVYASMSRSHSSLGRSPSGSGRLSLSAGTPRSERSVLSIPETVISSAEQGYSRASLKTESRTTSPSSLAEWSSHSLDRRGELSIAGLSLGEGRNISGISRRTDLSIMQSPARSETQALDYSPGSPKNFSPTSTSHFASLSPQRFSLLNNFNLFPDDTDSGVEMYHETTSASPGSYSSRRSSWNLSEVWMSEFEDSDGVSHHHPRSKERGDNSRADHSPSYSALHSRSQSGSARYSPASPTRNGGEYSPNTLRKLVSKELLESSHSRMRHHGDYYDVAHKRSVDSNIANSSNPSSRRHHGKRRDDSRQGASASSKVVVVLGKYDRRKGAHGRVNLDDTPVALDSLAPEEAIAVFHDEVARMMLEDGKECGEAADVEEFLDGYMRLRSPFYVAMVDEFFRAVCVDCYKRPVEVPVDGRSVSLSSKSLRSESQLHHHFHSFNTRM